MLALGTTREDYEYEQDEVVEVFPDHMTAIELFADLRTQWRVGAGGATGLDYSVIPIMFRMRGIKRSEWSELLSQIQIMENEALMVFHHKPASIH